MTKPERIKLAKKICKLYETNMFTAESCCETVGLSYDHFYNWITKGRSGYLQEIKEIYKEAKTVKRQNNNKELIRLARTALAKKLSFWEYEEVTTEVNGETTKTKTIIKTVIPTAADVAIALNNLDPDFDPQILHPEADIKDELKQVAEAIMKSDTE